jgi:hypothetical protein
MATLFTYARDAETDNPYLAVVADDNGASYVWPKGEEPWFDFETRQPFIQGNSPDPEDAEGWLSLASSGLGDFIILDPPFDDATSPAQAQKLAQTYLNATFEEPAPESPTLSGVPDAYDQIAQDYPGFGDDEAALGNEEGSMENLVLMALGPIDPDGPNGWIQRAMDGNPQEGDEDEYVHFPGTIVPEDDDEEEPDA